MAELVIDRGEIEVHLTGKFGLKVLDLQLDDEAAQLQVIEQKIQIVVLATDLEGMLALDERKADAELKDHRA